MFHYGQQIPGFGTLQSTETTNKKGMIKMEIIDYAMGVETIPQKVKSFVESRESFNIVNVKSGKQSFVVDIVEKAIEGAGLKCRVRTAGREWAAAGATIASLGVGVLAMAAIAGHDIATEKPDYEIVKEMIGSDMSVVYLPTLKSNERDLGGQFAKVTEDAKKKLNEAGEAVKDGVAKAWDSVKGVFS